MKLTQHQRIMILMAREPTRWFVNSDFMKPDLGELFVGYKAETRTRELRADYPDIFETRQDGRFASFRLKMETIKDWYYSLPDGFKKVLRQEGYEPKLSDSEILERNGVKFSDEG